jgi:AraC family transcriptional regulator, regulatory protein of adaptative response / DNA-3-methyladenine glycosylase II
VLPDIVARLRRQFDLRADPMEITQHLESDPTLARNYPQSAGIRLPGAFDGFEVAVRGILGQQVTVKGATTISGRLVERCGKRLRGGGTGTSRTFPTPRDLVRADLSQIGMPTARQTAVVNLGRAVHDGDVDLDGTADVGQTIDRLMGLRGIGEWTANYVAMRVLGDPDAFPATDLALRKALRPGKLVSAAVLRKRAESWRPWRGYAAAVLWRSLNQQSGG